MLTIRSGPPTLLYRRIRVGSVGRKSVRAFRHQPRSASLGTTITGAGLRKSAEYGVRFSALRRCFVWQDGDVGDIEIVDYHQTYCVIAGGHR